MRKVHGRAKRHQSLRTHLCGAKVLKDRKKKQIKNALAKQQKLNEKNKSAQ